VDEVASIRVGCQSWGYDDWVTPAGAETVFYPRGTRAGEMLELYAKVFDTIEVDATVYGVPAESTFLSWYEKTPPNFKFSLKAPRSVTHEASLSPAGYGVMEEFLERSRLLGEKLGAILIQLPAAFEPTKETGAHLRNFLEWLPEGFLYAVEFRHPGWFVDWTFGEFEAQGVSLALVEGKWVERASMFEAARRVPDKQLAYLRFMGLRDLEKFDRVQRPQDDILQTWHPVVSRLAASEIYIYMDNYFEGFAPATAGKMQRILGLPVSEPAALEQQLSLF
jgi:uncharacterized protein YecE (DUF72 family)